MKQVKYWTCNENDEILTETDLNEAIQKFIDNYEEEEIPSKIKVFGYNPMTINESYKYRLGLCALENFVESLDEKYGNPDEYTEITEEMKSIAKDFCDKIVKIYEVWSCEQVDVVEIDMIKWCAENEYDLKKKI